MSERFYCGPVNPEVGTIVRLSGPEMHHLVHVMRARPGDRVVLFDGLGHEFYAELVGANRNSAELRVLEVAAISRELPVPVSFACALPKGDRQRWLVEKLVELGVSRFVPLVTERTVVRPTAEALERLSRTVIESSKQCGRNHLMEIAPAERWNRFCARNDLPPLRVLAHPTESQRSFEYGPAGNQFVDLDQPGLSGATVSELLTRERLGEGVTVAIGPEGGFTADEVAQGIARGWSMISLGDRILRTETAAVMLAALIAGKLAAIV